MGFDCVYINSASSSNVIIGKEYLSGLEDRLKAVEEEIISLKGVRVRAQQNLGFDEECGGREFELDGATNISTIVSRNGEVEVDSENLQDSLGNENDTDGMGVMVFSAEEDCGFFGTLISRGLLPPTKLYQGHPQTSPLLDIYPAQWLTYPTMASLWL